MLPLTLTCFYLSRINTFQQRLFSTPLISEVLSDNFPPEPDKTRHRTDPLTPDLITQLYTLRFHKLLQSTFRVVAPACDGDEEESLLLRSDTILILVPVAAEPHDARHVPHTHSSSQLNNFGSILQGILLFIGKHPDTSSHTMRRHE